MTPRRALVISLDFEQYWGMRDCVPLSRYRENLLGVRQAVPAILKLFREYNIRATWAAVGFLFFEGRAELLEALPPIRPEYRNANLSPYGCIEKIGKNEKEDPFHFAPSLLREIAVTPGQEIGSHTLSHYYTMEPGQTAEAFEADLNCALQVARNWGIKIRSLVFPRNQVNQSYLGICRRAGIVAYRGAYVPSVHGRIARWAIMDNLTPIERITSETPFNIPGSVFFPPLQKGLRGRAFDEITYRRMARELETAAREQLVYHVWWHPDNFGVDTIENIARLRRFLDHFKKVQKRFGIESLNMGELADRLGAACSAIE